MKKTLLTLIAFVILTVSCGRPEITRDEENLLDVSLNNPVHQLKFYNFDPSKPLSQRWSLPSIVLDFIKQYDERPDYKLYEPSGEEKTAILDAINRLPVPMKAAIEKRIVGIVFIEGFRGSGMTDFIYDDNGRMYNYFVFNKDVFENVALGMADIQRKNLLHGTAGLRRSRDGEYEHGRFPYIIAARGASSFGLRAAYHPVRRAVQQRLCAKQGRQSSGVDRLHERILGVVLQTRRGLRFRIG
jgi:hypothetical protein